MHSRINVCCMKTSPAVPEALPYAPASGCNMLGHTLEGVAPEALPYSQEPGRLDSAGYIGLGSEMEGGMPPVTNPASPVKPFSSLVSSVTRPNCLV